MLTTAFFLATGWPRTTGAASRSTGWTAYTVAVLNVVAVPLTHQATTQVGRDRQWLGEPPVTSTMSGRT